MQTAFRLEPKLIGRLKEAARQANISVNEYVTVVLTAATEDVMTEMEREEERKKTRLFLESVAGKWSGGESVSELLASIREGRTERKMREL